MAKKIMMQDYAVDMNTDVNVINEKLPPIQESRMKEMQDFMEIPVERLEMFRNKKIGDFSRWDEAKFEELKESILEHGVIEPITVRAIPDSNRFEILAGEHRWTASRELGLPTVPARVKYNCDDDEAIAIFSLTNVMKRDTTLKDRAFGCWLYTTKTKYKTATRIRELIDQGILSKEEMAEPLSRTQMYRYSKLHELPLDIFELVEKNHVDLKTGARLGLLNEEQQEDLSKYIHFVKSSSLANKVVDLAQNKLDGMTWSDDTLYAILAGKEKVKIEPNKTTLSYASQQAKQVIKEMLPPECYQHSDTILREALKLYMEKHNIAE